MLHRQRTVSIRYGLRRAKLALKPALLFVCSWRNICFQMLIACFPNFPHNIIWKILCYIRCQYQLLAGPATMVRQAVLARRSRERNVTWNFGRIFENLSHFRQHLVRFRLYRHRSLQVKARFAEFFEIYKNMVFLPNELYLLSLNRLPNTAF